MAISVPELKTGKWAVFGWLSEAFGARSLTKIDSRVPSLVVRRSRYASGSDGSVAGCGTVERPHDTFFAQQLLRETLI